LPQRLLHFPGNRRCLAFEAGARQQEANMKKPFASLLIAIALTPTTCLASSAPVKLLNTSINASFTAQATSHSEDGLTNADPRLHSLKIFVSSAGRLFVRHFTKNGLSRTDDIGPGPRFQIEGNKIIGVFPGISGATQMTIDFSDDFHSCSLSLIAGKQNGNPRVWIGVDGRRWTSSAPMVFANQSCSVQPGNVLANQ
jgi:hypothetical protein